MANVFFGTVLMCFVLAAVMSLIAGLFQGLGSIITHFVPSAPPPEETGVLLGLGLYVFGGITLLVIAVYSGLRSLWRKSQG